MKIVQIQITIFLIVYIKLEHMQTKNTTEFLYRFFRVLNYYTMAVGGNSGSYGKIINNVWLYEYILN